MLKPLLTSIAPRASFLFEFKEPITLIQDSHLTARYASLRQHGPHAPSVHSHLIHPMRFTRQLSKQQPQISRTQTFTSSRPLGPAARYRQYHYYNGYL